LGPALTPIGATEGVFCKVLEEVESMAGGNTLEFTEQNFEQEVLKAEQLVLVDFWAEWCAPCRMISPAVDAIAKEFAGRVKVGKLNVDENLSLTTRYNVRSIPTLLIFKAGQIQEQVMGATSRDSISKLLEKHLSQVAEKRSQ
jgi:thioredoxin